MKEIKKLCLLVVCCYSFLGIAFAEDGKIYIAESYPSKFEMSVGDIFYFSNSKKQYIKLTDVLYDEILKMPYAKAVAHNDTYTTENEVKMYLKSDYSKGIKSALVSDTIAVKFSSFDISKKTATVEAKKDFTALTPIIKINGSQKSEIIVPYGDDIVFQYTTSDRIQKCGLNMVSSGGNSLSLTNYEPTFLGSWRGVKNDPNYKMKLPKILSYVGGTVYVYCGEELNLAAQPIRAFEIKVDYSKVKNVLPVCSLTESPFLNKVKSMDIEGFYVGIKTNNATHISLGANSFYPLENKTTYFLLPKNLINEKIMFQVKNNYGKADCYYNKKLNTTVYTDLSGLSSKMQLAGKFQDLERLIWSLGLYKNKKGVYPDSLQTLQTEYSDTVGGISLSNVYYTNYASCGSYHIGILEPIVNDFRLTRDIQKFVKRKECTEKDKEFSSDYPIFDFDTNYAYNDFSH